MKIKTVIHDDPGTFDTQVNKALGEGYHLTRRGLEPVGGDVVTLYAELVLPDAPREGPVPDVLTAARVIKDHCNSCQSCRDCLLDDICDLEPPTGWTFQDKEPEA